MALFNKLFSSRKNCCKNQDSVCEKVFVFSKDQVRIVLFRECDFRGRKLLFDSHSVEKVALTTATGSQLPLQNSTATPNKLQEKYVEVSNGYGYQYVKPCSDISQLGEMVFGSVAMSYRGTSLKIHSLASPARLMCSQIFPSPRHPARGSSFAPSHSCARSSITSSQSLEQSIRLDDSGTSSANSISDRLSVNSSGSDTLLVCRGSRSIPLDVPTANVPAALNNNNNLTPSFVGDSGFSGEQSYNSISSGPQSLPLWCTLNEDESFSCGSLYKRWLRSASTSLEYSSNSLTGSASTDECMLRPHSRSSKLGLAVIIELPPGQEQSMEQFLMEHAALIESMVWRTRQGAEIAYIRHTSFVSLMCDVATSTIQWLVDLLSGPQLATHLWISLAPVCDKFNSISYNSRVKNSNEKSNNFSYSNSTYVHSAYRTMSLSDLDDKCSSDAGKAFTNSSSCVSLNNSLRSDVTNSFDSSDTLDKSSDFTFLNLTKFLKSEWAAVSAKNSYSSSDKNMMAEKCVTELCELLESVDVKHTNFFVSTLVTAVLTHHLGWVTTVLPPSSSDKEKVTKLHNPCNPLWGQLTDLYGAIGHPTKVAHTVVTGTNKAELISKILNALTYFIRCSDTQRKCVTRLDIKEDNKKVDCICQQKSCIPKANYKKYEDHLREMEVSNNEFFANKCDMKQTYSTCSRYKNSNELVNSSPLENIEMCNLTNIQKIAVEKQESVIDLKNDSKPEVKSTKPLGLSKANTCLTNLYKISEENINCSSKTLYPSLEDLCKNENINLNEIDQSVKHPESSSHQLLDKVKTLGIQAMQPFPNDYIYTNDVINEKVRKLCRVPTSAILYHIEPAKEDQQLIDIQEASKQIMKVFAPKKIDMEKQMKSAESTYKSNKVLNTKTSTQDDSIMESKVTDTNHTECKNVIFVLGDDEELVGLRKDGRDNLVDTCSIKSTDNCQNNNCKMSRDICCNNLNATSSKSDSYSLTSSSSEATPTDTKYELDDNTITEPPVKKLLRPQSLTIGMSKSKTSLFDISTETSKEKDELFVNSKFKDSDFTKCNSTEGIKPSTSWTTLDMCNDAKTNHSSKIDLESECGSVLKSNPQVDQTSPKEFNRSQSVPPENKKPNSDTPAPEVKSKYRYSGVKFNIQQYPQIVTNYMRSKNLEMLQLPFTEKNMKLNVNDFPPFDFSTCDTNMEEVETLQTPSNASELEFTSDLIPENYEAHQAKEKIERKPKTFTRNHLPNTVVQETSSSECNYLGSLRKTAVNEHPLQISDRCNNAMFEHEESNSSEEENCTDIKPQPIKMQIIELPLPKSQPICLESTPINYTTSLMRGVGDRYISDMVLQGTSAPKSEWESALRRDLSLATRHPLLDQPVDEAIAIVANTDTWEVQLLSSHTYVVDKGSSGVRVGMSQLVANMLETLLHMWKLHTPPEYCIMHIEQRLQEFCTLSKALAELLLATEFCSMDLLTSVLQLEVNDVPLLMAVASTHSPQVTQKYGLSFQ